MPGMLRQSGSETGAANCKAREAPEALLVVHRLCTQAGQLLCQQGSCSGLKVRVCPPSGSVNQYFVSSGLISSVKMASSYVADTRCDSGRRLPVGSGGSCLPREHFAA